MTKERTRWTQPKAREFGGRLRRLRELAGLSQRALAQGTSVTAAYVSRIEKGERYPSVVVIRELAANLGVAADHLELGDAGAAVCATADARRINLAAKRFGADLRWEDLDQDERAQVTQGLDEALIDTVVARIHVIALNRAAWSSRQ